MHLRWGHWRTMRPITRGIPIAVNPSVGVAYPKLASEFGRTVTYADNPTAHLRVEFGFDVLQVARGNYAPQSYHDFIGFETSKDLLNRAFLATYGLELKDVFTDVDLALGTYRRAVSSRHSGDDQGGVGS